MRDCSSLPSAIVFTEAFARGQQITCSEWVRSPLVTP
jgi:hypothetical protein